jgi:hypothetical protein
MWETSVKRSEAEAPLSAKLRGSRQEDIGMSYAIEDARNDGNPDGIAVRTMYGNESVFGGLIAKS